MHKVEIYKLQNDGAQVVIATCRLQDGTVDCDGDMNFVTHLKEEGIIDYSQKAHTKVFPKDGMLFLKQLQYNFKSGYLNASEVIEE